MDTTTCFEAARPFLLGLAYRILGSHSEAEDAVQDTFLKWHATDTRGIDNPRAWLTTLCTRHCIDQLRSAHKARTDYVGTWLPESIQTEPKGSPEQLLELSTSLSTAFLLLLERLTPKERAAYLLHDIFDTPYEQVASTLGISDQACRKLVSRARSSVAQGKPRHLAPRERQMQLLDAFQEAIASGSSQRFAALLSQDVELCADGGGKVPTIRQTLHGKADVLAFVNGALREYWATYSWQHTDTNGGRGILLVADGRVVALVTFAYDDAGRASNIYIMRNPDKLAHLAPEDTRKKAASKGGLS